MQNQTRSYLSMDVYIRNLLHRQNCDFNYYCDFLYIDGCSGEFPDLYKFAYARRVFISNCVITSAASASLPNWIESLNIETCDIRELPALSSSLTRLRITRSTVETLPALPAKLSELVLEHLPNLERLPALPLNLGKLIFIHTSVSKLPELPDKNLYVLYCWDNRLESLPYIPKGTGLMSIRCYGNPFRKMPWIDLLHYSDSRSNKRSESANNPTFKEGYYRDGGFSSSKIKVDRDSIETVRKFREMYYAVRLREQFKRWLWRPREREAMAELHPSRIAEFVENVPPEKMGITLDQFYRVYVSSKN